MDNPKAAKLTKLFQAIISDKQPLTPQNKPLFLEAVYTSPDPAGCIDNIIHSTKGLSSLQSSLRMDTSTSFLNDTAHKVVLAFSAEEVSSIANGTHVQKVVMAIVEPPIFWGALLREFQAGQLGPRAQKALAWLLQQLVKLPLDKSGEYVKLAQDPSIIDVLAASPEIDIRGIASNISYCVKNLGTVSHSDLQNGPGGRHDNDHADFRKISILPTAAELETTSEKAFLRPSSWLDDPSTEKTRVPDHLDNQFRLLREDMVSEMREEVQIALGKKKSHHKGFVIEGITLKGLYYKGSDNKECKWALTFQCKADLWQFRRCKDVKQRNAYVKDNPRFMKHHSLTCLLMDGQVAAFPSVIRDGPLLAQKPPTIVLRFDDERSTVNALFRLQSAKNIRLIQIDTAVFSYEPILTALQEKKGVPLEEEILFFNEGMGLSRPIHYPSSLVTALKCQTTDLQSLLRTPKPINLDQAQLDALVNALSQRVALIQGPPGTGKSFVGALCAKILLEQPEVKILVNCYTNHALDQFLEDLLDIGIPESEIVRIGGKSTLRTAPLSLQTLGKSAGYRLSKKDWRVIEGLRTRRNSLSTALEASFAQYKAFDPGFRGIMEHLQFDYPDFAEAFYVPPSEDDAIVVGKKGKPIETFYLLRRWWHGQDAGVFQDVDHIKTAQEIWKMDHPARLARYESWRQELMKEQIEHLYQLGRDHNECVDQLEATFRLGEGSILQTRRVIGCTTTGSAMYRGYIKAAGPTVLLVEEAGEILEPHTITAMSDSIQQVILIGDHKQLRPKVNKFYLTVEKGEGFDLNRSLFERLVLKNYPHAQLKAQHRMRPEISALVRHLTYDYLQDAPKTQGRPDIRGIRSNVVFINHEQPEDEVAAEERIDMKSSKQNQFEVQMVLKIIRYLGQQGYGTDKLVILTPYLGQLRALMDALKKAQQIDPVLSDLDYYDVVAAGLMSESAAKSIKKPIRLATIDNYQGEESDIVIASLTRSNPDREIGFMASPERLNVLLSRARDGLIIIGNTHTFTEARRGGEVWTSLIELLKKNGNIYDGLPVVCDRHPGRRALLKTPADFDKDCPDGGCNLPCGTMLSCKQHPCPSKCHQLADHSQMLCEQVSTTQCPAGHSQQWKCHKGPPPTCIKCERQQELAEKKRQERFALQERRDAEQRDHERQMAELEAEEARERETIRYAQEDKERKRALEQKRMDVEAAVEQARAATSPTAQAPTRPEPPGPTDSPLAASVPVAPLADTPIPKPRPTPTVSTSPSTQNSAAKPKTSAAKEEWERQKRLDGAVNPPIDAIMAMTGLEDVKKQVLRIKSKVDTSIRQGTDLKGERFNIAMLGNPGTGKTTVARHYAKFLASINIIPTDTFFETTGSRLTNDGVPGIKKQVETMLSSDGGTIFVDEAYQLTTNGGGKQVLDFILAEMENNVGKIVWIVAGYNREMEQFFEHNPGLQSRVPYTLQFKDYEDDELLSMLEGLVAKQFGGKMKVEEGINGLYARIAIRRLGRGRGRNGFGNARALRNLFDKIRGRQAERLSEERRAGNRPDDFLLLRQDLIGPDPSSVMVKSKAWKTLQSMIGLEPVKKSVQNLFDMTMLNYQRELKELHPDAVSLNRVFLGSPGTGKTTVAKHYGQILAELGLISNGEVVIKNPADFVGGALGESEANTKSILANTAGKVLIIDEAYMLYASSGAPGGTADPYKTAVIDTIVAEVQSVPGEDRCVLLLGYKDQMEEMFQNVNPGFSRRFSIENAFHFNDYSNSELLQALDWKLKSQDRTATDTAKQVAIEVLARQRQRPNFGNIGEVENLLSAAKTRSQERQSSLPLNLRNPNAPFEPQDFDPEFDRSKDAASNLAGLFEDMVGAENIIGKLHKWQQMAKIRKAKGMDLQMIPTNFIFKGPPGVGKTTVARKMGAVYYDMGILSSKEVVECSASDLVGQYVGQTGPKTKKQFEKALGRVLFIDEAYRLGEGHFAKEAMDELVGILTHEKFRGKLIVILAGYDQEMNDLLQVNTGLTSRFPEEIVFPNIPPAKCLEILDRKLRKESIVFPALNDSSQPTNVHMIKLIEKLSVLPSWGNARDMETLAQKLCEVAFTREDVVTDGTLEISAEDAIDCISTMLAQRQERVENRRVAFNNVQMQPLAPPPSLHQPPTPPTLQTVQTTKKMEVADQLPQEATLDQKGRDPGVSDAIWEQLQRDKQVAEEAQRRSDEAMEALEDEERTTAEQGKAIENALQNAPDGGDDELQELKRRREAIRLQELRARATREAEARKRAEEVRVQAKLQRVGNCVAGFAWIKQANGYCCAGGAHFVTNAALGL